MLQSLRPAIVMMAIFTILCGLIYPLAMTGIADLLRLLGVGDGVMWLIPITLAVLAVASTVTVVQRILVVRQQALAAPPAE